MSECLTAERSSVVDVFCLCVLGTLMTEVRKLSESLDKNKNLLNWFETNEYFIYILCQESFTSYFNNAIVMTASTFEMESKSFDNEMTLSFFILFLAKQTLELVCRSEIAFFSIEYQLIVESLCCLLVLYYNFPFII